MLFWSVGSNIKEFLYILCLRSHSSPHPNSSFSTPLSVHPRPGIRVPYLSNREDGNVCVLIDKTNPPHKGKTDGGRYGSTSGLFSFTPETLRLLQRMEGTPVPSSLVRRDVVFLLSSPTSLSKRRHSSYSTPTGALRLLRGQTNNPPPGHTVRHRH